MLGDRERALQKRFVLFASLLIVIIFGTAVGVLLSAAQRANDVEVQAGLRTLNAVLDNHIEELRGRALEAAFWDDMVEQVDNGFDPLWVDDNIGRFLHDTVDLSLTIVIDKENQPLVYIENGERQALLPFENMTSVFEQRLEDLRQGPSDPPGAAAGLLFLSDEILVVGMAPISPEYPEPDYLGHDRAIFLIGRALTQERLSEIAGDFGLAGLSLTKTAPTTPAIQQFDLAGKSIGWMTWTPKTPGHSWLRIILPGLAVAFLAVMILGAMLTRLWRSALIRMRQQEKNLMVAVEDAMAASRAKTVFLASMSHELRTPLNAVIGFSNILKAEMFGPVGSPKYLEYVKDIHATSNHLLNLIDSILDWAKLEAEQPVLNEQICMVEDVFASAVTLADPRAANLTITSHISPSGLAIRGDRTKLIQIVTNLLTNAIKASEAGQEISLSARHEGDGMICIDVRDQGRGIVEDEIANLFQPFQRSSDPYRRATPGVGLGLVVSMRLAELHQGSIQLRNNAGHDRGNDRGHDTAVESGTGTVASLRLPAERAVLDAVNALRPDQTEPDQKTNAS